mgnify:CR=1 FL=1
MKEEAVYTILKCPAPDCPGHGGDSPIIGTCAGHQFDLRGADLSGANLSKAHLYETNLSGADLNWATGIVVAGPCGGRMMYGVRHAGGMMVQAGCWWARPAWLREHWKAMSDGEKASRRAEHARLRLACLEALEVQARALEWGDVDCQPE